MYHQWYILVLSNQPYNIRWHKNHRRSLRGTGMICHWHIFRHRCHHNNMPLCTEMCRCRRNILCSLRHDMRYRTQRRRHWYGQHRMWWCTMCSRPCLWCCPWQCQLMNNIPPHNDTDTPLMWCHNYYGFQIDADSQSRNSLMCQSRMSCPYNHRYSMLCWTGPQWQS